MKTLLLLPPVWGGYLILLVTIWFCVLRLFQKSKSCQFLIELITVQGRHCHLKLLKTSGSFFLGLLKPNYVALAKTKNYGLSWSCSWGTSISKLSIRTMYAKKESCSNRKSTIELPTTRNNKSESGKLEWMWSSVLWTGDGWE